MVSPKELWESYSKCSFSEKRDTVLSLLDSIRAGQSVLENIYAYVYDAPPTLSEAELDETYDALLHTAYEIDQERQEKTKTHLRELSEHMKAMQQKELEQKGYDVASANSILNSMT